MEKTKNEKTFIIFVTIILLLICLSMIKAFAAKTTKSDFIGTWWDLYSQRAHLSVKDIGSNQLQVNIVWSSSAISNTEWVYHTCNYQDTTGDLVCTNGEEIQTYVLCNGRRIDSTGEAGECYAGSGENPKEVREIVKENLQVVFSIKKGNLKEAMGDNYFNGYRNDIMRNSKDMTLYVKNTSSDEEFKNCIFHIYK